MAKKTETMSYNELPDHPDLALTLEGLWLTFPRETEEDTYVGEFIRLFERAPEHAIPDNWRLFVGPVFDEEELTFRQQGRQRERDKVVRKRTPAKEDAPGRYLDATRKPKDVK